MPRPFGGDDRGDNAVVVRLFVLNFFLFAQQFLDDVRIIARKLLPDTGTGVFGCNAPIDAYKAIDRGFIPIIKIFLRRFDLCKFLLRIVNERRKRLLLLHGERALELLFDLLADRAGTVLQNMQKRLVFPVDIRDEMFRSLWQIEHGRKIDDLRRRVCRGRKLNG